MVLIVMPPPLCLCAMLAHAHHTPATPTIIVAYACLTPAISTPYHHMVLIVVLPPLCLCAMLAHSHLTPATSTTIVAHACLTPAISTTITAIPNVAILFYSPSTNYQLPSLV